jgi:hypothetical protein
LIIADSVEFARAPAVRFDPWPDYIEIENIIGHQIASLKLFCYFWSFL